MKVIACEIPDIEIRGVEQAQGKNGRPDYLIVRYDHVETGKAGDLVDSDVERKSLYKRGQVGTLLVEYVEGKTKDGEKYSKLRVIGFKPAPASAA